ncbi:hypothetical protein [Williamsia sp. CHRR-6]|uniref:hypothetical protein n=1 Tax=Williamsia sp. CHRR-6 TaxID=2835871 RepID=UPI001BDB52CF|nr:hypothetical protein [Williamsia sp. CHRR-6]MBT0566066.1 hypothetical protein [Williamsia sp. CHRR-6]
MVRRSDGVDDLESVLGTPVTFVEDPQDWGWLVGSVGRERIYLRMGNFPDEELWSLWLGDGRWMNFTEPPANWTIDRSPGGWPDSARPRLPKGEFYE